MLIELSVDQLEYLVNLFEDHQEVLSPFEEQLFEVLEQAWLEADD